MKSKPITSKSNTRQVDPCLGLVQATWKLPSFRRDILLNLHSYWLYPLREFYVSYDYLNRDGFFKTSLQPYASVFPILFKMFKQDDSFMRSKTGYPRNRFDPNVMPKLIPLVRTEGRQYLKVFSNQKTRNQLRDMVTAPILDKLALNTSEYTMLWDDVDYTARCVPNACPPFLMLAPEYEGYLIDTATKSRQLIQAGRAIGKAIKELH